jgi:hypothetical protein
MHLDGLTGGDSPDRFRRDPAHMSEHFAIAGNNASYHLFVSGTVPRVARPGANRDNPRFTETHFMYFHEIEEDPQVTVSICKTAAEPCTYHSAVSMDCIVGALWNLGGAPIDPIQSCVK